MIFLAKDDGTLLLDHSKKVADVAKLISNRYTNKLIEDKDQFEELVQFGSLLHDIGKCTKGFQDWLKNPKKKKKSIGYVHNQVGAAYLHYNLNHPSKDEIVHLVCWHHGVYENVDYQKIYQEIPEADINSMRVAAVELIGEKYLDKYNDKNGTPCFYGEFTKNEAKVQYAQSILIAADTLVSEYTEKMAENILDTYVETNRKKSKTKYADMIMPKHYDPIRYSQQQQINSILGRTTQINMTAGGGKTLLGLMFFLSGTNKLFWVCPRNTVGYSVYDSLLNELAAFGIKDVRVQLYLTGRICEANYKTGEDDNFDADIIVINIDNYLKLTYDNARKYQDLGINTTSVVFDEYHELIQDKALFYIFITTMCVRNRCTNAQTLLLSATGNIISSMWDTFNFETTILPGKNKHYAAIHDKKYEVVVEPVYGDNSLVIFNAVENAQNFLRDNKREGDIISHSYYEDHRKKEIIDNIHRHYDKGCNGLKPGTVSAPIIQASLDISYLNLSESVSSPDNTMQRCGRCNRDGKYNNAKLCFFMPNNKSERFAINYDLNLLGAWFKILIGLNGKYITLDEMYYIYDKFNVDNEDDIRKYNQRMLSESLKRCNEIYPRKFFDNLSLKKKVHSANGNKLRSSGKAVFIIVQKDDGTWTDAFCDSNYYDRVDKYGDDVRERLKVMESLADDDRFDYKVLHKRHKKNITLKTLEKYANMSNTPLVVFDFSYNDEYGRYKIKKTN